MNNQNYQPWIEVTHQPIGPELEQIKPLAEPGLETLIDQHNGSPIVTNGETQMYYPLGGSDKPVACDYPLSKA